MNITYIPMVMVVDNTVVGSEEPSWLSVTILQL